MTNPPDPLAKFLGEMEKESHGLYSDYELLQKAIKICRIQAEALKDIITEGHSNLCETMKPVRPGYICHVEIANEAIKSVNQIAAESGK